MNAHAVRCTLCAWVSWLSFGLPVAAEEGVWPENLQREQLVAWCIVPFDAAKRGPEARAKMLQALGLKRCAYDWRTEHVSVFEEEIRQYQKHGIEFFAFWSGHEEAYRLFEKHHIHPQIWHTAPSPDKPTQKARVQAAADQLEPLARRLADLQCPLGLYNHGGWGGRPVNLVAVCEELRRRGHAHVGIVYNWHHGHDDMGTWQAALALMQPYLLCVNLNGMNPEAEPKILALGKGQEEKRMLRMLIDSGYRGPVGILDHQATRDTEAVLKENLEGLELLKNALP